MLQKLKQFSRMLYDFTIKILQIFRRSQRGMKVSLKITPKATPLILRSSSMKVAHFKRASSRPTPSICTTFLYLIRTFYRFYVILHMHLQNRHYREYARRTLPVDTWLTWSAQILVPEFNWNPIEASVKYECTLTFNLLICTYSFWLNAYGHDLQFNAFDVSIQSSQ